MSKTEKAGTYFHSGYNCAQSVLVPFGPELGLEENLCLKVACAYGAGMGRQQYTCGAVTGALMALGLKYGMGTGDPAANKLLTYDKTREFFRIFKERHGNTECLALLDGLRMDHPADKQRIEELDLHNTRCALLVEDAVKIAESLMQ